jgi:hypothetical protein
MPTFIDGIGASENLDSSGERIIIAGLDISSLDKDGIFNYEHKNDQPSQIVGKVLKAKKIFSDKDCEDDRHRYYWQKVQVPYLYVMGELFDDYKDSAKDVAGMFRYDAAKKGQNERNVMNFSVEGAKISKEGMDITRSIARKITITVLPCNKAAIAEMVPTSGAKPKDDLDGIFKTESVVEIELIKSDDKMGLWDMLKKADPGLHAKALGIKPIKKDLGGGLSLGASSGLSGGGPTSSGGIIGTNMTRAEKKLSVANKNGVKIGRTTSGRDVFSHGRVGEYGFGSEEHKEAAAHHQKAAEAAKDPRLGRHHWDKARMHMNAGNTASDVKARTTVTPKQIAAQKPSPSATSTTKTKTLHDPELSGKVSYKKSEGMEKGSNNFEEAPYPGSRFQGNMNTTRQKGINKPVPGGPIGESGANIHGPNFVGGSKKTARNIHRKVLGQMRSMPKPNLPKSEEMSKADDTHWIDHKSGHAAGVKSSGDKKTHEISLYHKNPHQLKGPEHFPTKKMTFHGTSNDAKRHAENALGHFADMNKGLDAGSMNAAPGQLSGGAALGKENLSGKMQVTPKSKWLKRAEEEYAKWEKREQFEEFMSKRVPHLAKGEIKAIGKTLALSKAMKAEKKLAKMGIAGSGAQNYQGSYVGKKDNMAKALKFDFKPSGGPIDKDAGKSKIPERHKGKGTELKGTVHSEVDHVEPHFSGSHDAIYLKTGHQSHVQPKGKFKVGDKVTMTPHIQGTHVLEHKK